VSPSRIAAANNKTAQGAEASSTGTSRANLN
jgi:hypothetical protein